MKETPIIVIKRDNWNKISNLIIGIALITFGFLLLYSLFEIQGRDSITNTLFIFFATFFILGGLYCWIFITHQVYLFPYEIQSRVFLFTKKIPIDWSTTYSYKEYKSESTTLHVLHFITSTQNKKLSIKSKCWDNEDKFLTELNKQTSRIRSSTPHLKPKLAKLALRSNQSKRRKRKKKKRNKRKN